MLCRTWSADAAAASQLSGSSSTVAKQQIVTLVGSALSSAVMQALLVAPLVSTSSTRITSRPLTNSARRRGTSIAPLSDRWRAFRDIPPSIGVALRRASASTASFPLPCRASSFANRAAWLNPPRHKRQRCKGKGNSSGGASRGSGSFAAISHPSCPPSAILPPCLKARTSLRDASLYSVAAAIPS